MPQPRAPRPASVARIVLLLWVAIVYAAYWAGYLRGR